LGLHLGCPVRALAAVPLTLNFSGACTTLAVKTSLNGTAQVGFRQLPSLSTFKREKRECDYSSNVGRLGIRSLRTADLE